jgi:hypothetical protein
MEKRISVKETPKIAANTQAGNPASEIRSALSDQLTGTLALASAPKDGFNDAQSYTRYVLDSNKRYAHEHEEFRSSGSRFRLKDSENPGKLRGHILTECADGRNSLMLFIPQGDELSRFDYVWLPSAGVIFVPEFDSSLSMKKIQALFDSDPQVKQNIFERFDMLFGPKINEGIRDYENGILSTIHVEFQSHFDSHHYPNHGCGAWGSNLVLAQLETIKNCMVAQIWLKDRYPEEFQKGIFKVYRTTHDTIPEGPVYSAAAVDRAYVQDKALGSEHLLDFAAEHYEPSAKADADEGVVRKFEGNPTKIETDKHDEQTIRISNTHFASTIKGQSVLEITWTNNISMLFDHIRILLGIIEKNFRNRNPIKPAILHFDLVKGDKTIQSVYAQLMNLIGDDSELSRRIKEKSLIICATETDRQTYKTNVLEAN